MTDNPRAAVLVVDDDPLVLRTTAASLRGRYDVRVAESGVRALALVAESEPDVVVTDLAMPGMTGHELLRTLRAENPRIGRIAFSGNPDQSRELSLLAHCTFLAKPVGQHQLFVAIEAVLAARPHADAGSSLLERSSLVDVEAASASPRERFANLEFAARDELESRLIALAHELNNSLSAVVTSLSTLVADGAGSLDSASQKELLEDSLTASRRAMESVRLVVKRMRRSPRPESATADACEVLRKATGFLRRRVELSIPPAPVQVRVPELELLHLALNLLQNASEAAATRVSVSLTVCSRGPVQLAQIVVADDGPGVPPQIKARLFEEFVSTKPHGMGLGLSVAQKIVTRAGGRIDLVNSPLNGAAFLVELPVHQSGGEPRA